MHTWPRIGFGWAIMGGGIASADAALLALARADVATVWRGRFTALRP